MAVTTEKRVQFSAAWRLCCRVGRGPLLGLGALALAQALLPVVGLFSMQWLVDAVAGGVVAAEDELGGSVDAIQELLSIAIIDPRATPRWRRTVDGGLPVHRPRSLQGGQRQPRPCRW